METWTWLLGLAAVGYLVIKWNSDRIQRNKTSEFFRTVLDKNIEEREAAIKALTKKQAESLEDYYAKRKKYNSDFDRNHKLNPSDDTDGKGT